MTFMSVVYIVTQSCQSDCLVGMKGKYNFYQPGRVVNGWHAWKPLRQQGHKSVVTPVFLRALGSVVEMCR